MYKKITLKNTYRPFAFSFFIGLFLPTIPNIYKFIENFRNQIVIQEQIKIQIQNKKKICKDYNSDYIKFLNLGFPETANRKFNTCMIDK